MSDSINLHDRFWIFEMPHYHACGGLDDVTETFDEFEDAKQYFEERALIKGLSLDLVVFDSDLREEVLQTTIN